MSVRAENTAWIEPSLVEGFHAHRADTGQEQEEGEGGGPGALPDIVGPDEERDPQNQYGGIGDSRRGLDEFTNAHFDKWPRGR